MTNLISGARIFHQFFLLKNSTNRQSSNESRLIIRLAVGEEFFKNPKGRAEKLCDCNNVVCQQSSGTICDISIGILTEDPSKENIERAARFYAETIRNLSRAEAMEVIAIIRESELKVSRSVGEKTLRLIDFAEENIRFRMRQSSPL